MCIVYSMNPTIVHCTGQAGHGSGRLLGKDDIAARAHWPSIHKLILYDLG